MQEYQLEKFLPSMARLGTAPDFPSLTLFLESIFHRYSATDQRETRFSIAESLQQHLMEDGLGNVYCTFMAGMDAVAIHHIICR